MAKMNQLDKAIAALEAKRDALDAAIAELKEQKRKAPAARRPRAVPEKVTA